MSALPCPHCDQFHPASAVFCPVTGIPLAQAQPKQSLLPFILSVSAVSCVLIGIGVWMLLGNQRPTLTGITVFPSPHQGLAAAANNTSLATPSAHPTRTPAPNASPTTRPRPTDTSLPAATSPPTPAPLTGLIVFVSYRDQDEEIYLMSTDGSNQTRLTYSQYGDVEPVMRPDGQQIVFVSQRLGSHRLFIMNVDGSDQRPLTDGQGGREYDPYFSPDGQWIVFSTERGGQFDIWLIRPDGSDLTQLTSGPGGKNLPAWSPSGDWIAYSTIEDGEDAIRIIRPDGTNERTVLKQDEAHVSGWIGNRILYVAKNGATTDIFSIGFDGTDPWQLTTDPANDKGPFGTRDGQFVIFNSARDGNDEIYVMRADGSNQTRITFSARNDYMPTWGP